jgi:protein gp37
MGANSKIEWTDHTFNPWIGCTHAGPGCDHCYAEVSTAARATSARIGASLWGPGAPRHRTSAGNWKQPERWNQQAAAAGVRRRVFCASLADVFDNAVPPAWRRDLLALIASTPNLDWLLLTKRIGNASRMLQEALDGLSPPALAGISLWADLPFPNVWLGATVVNQEEADRDIPKLLATPARIRFLSIEPMLGPIDLDRVRAQIAPGSFETGSCLYADDGFGLNAPRNRIDWVIVGGESGQHARPMHSAWPRALCNQCSEAGVPFLFKQWGEWLPGDQNAVSYYSIEDDRGVHEFTTPARTDADWALRVGKKAAGRLLYGVTHDGFPVHI